MNKRPKTIGILCDEPLIAAVINREIIKNAPIDWFLDQPDVAVYARNLGDAEDSYKIYEGTRVLRKMDVDFTIIPEMDDTKHDWNNTHNRTKILNTKLEPISYSMVEGLEYYVAHNVKPDNDKDIERFNELMDLAKEWAGAALSESFRLYSYRNNSIIFPNRSKPDLNNRDAATDASRHSSGLVGIHGGMGCESSNDAIIEVAMKSDASVLMIARASTPHVVYAIDEFREKQSNTLIDSKDPSNVLIDTRGKLIAARADSVVMACNTAHYFHDYIMDGSKPHDAVNILQAGLQAVPKGGTALYLGTASTRASVIEDEIKASNYIKDNKITIILPSTEDTKKINDIIWEHSVVGKHDVALAEFEKVVARYSDQLGKDGHIIAGCTEITLAYDIVQGEADRNPVIDNSLIAVEKAIKIAHKKAVLRQPKGIADSPHSAKQSYLNR